MHSSDLSPLARCVLAALFLALSGCASSQYKTTHGGPRPTRAFDLCGRSPSAEARVQTVIVRGGHGSWKHDAWWDEYVVSLTNHGKAPLILNEAQLHSEPGKVALPGADPWHLEDQSKTLWAQIHTNEAALGMGLLAVGGLLIQCVTLDGLKGIDLATAANKRISANDAANAARVESEFHRRRLSFPIRLAPGETRTGSLFFRITPGPSVLRLTGRCAQQPGEVTVNLAAIANIHRPDDSGPEPTPVGETLAPLGPTASAR